jgi:DNA-binding winged helix-turn-helix (wHTH) protein
MESSPPWSSLVPAHGERDPHAHAHARSALHAAASGERREAEALIAEIERGDLEHGDLDRAFAHLARGVLLALDGETVRADDELRRALLAATHARVDPGHVIATLRGLGDVIVIDGSGRRRVVASAELALASETTVIDARHDTLTVRGDRRSLHRYSVRRRMLYTLARQPGSVLGKDTIVEAVWACAYDPLRHDDLLKATVLHLRRVLADSGLVIRCGHPGYRLDASVPFALVTPFVLGRGDSPRFTDASLSARVPQ